jgi:hypothetical protein
MRTATARILNRRQNSGWRALTWVLVLAFGLQSYITQTHIHGAASSFDMPAAGKIFFKTPAPAGSGDRNDAGDCPLCQAIVHAGTFFAPVVLALLLPTSWTEQFVLIRIASPVTGGGAYHWQSRAPPRG